MFNKMMIRGLLAAVLVASAVAVQADVFQMPTGQTSLETVWVADTKNAADTTVMNDSTTGYGKVDYAYQMGTYEVTNAQYTQFLNAKLPDITVLTNDTFGLYNSGMGASTYGGISYTSGAASGAKFAAKSGYENRPVNYVSWYDSLRFANWLQNGQGAVSTESGTYTIDDGGPNSGTVTIPTAEVRASWDNAHKHWVLPSENEWYKAAYYDPNKVGGAGYWLYPTKSNDAPYSDNPASLAFPTNSANYRNNDGLANGYNDGYAVGSPYLTNVGAYASSSSPYGTFDQGGNVWEWNEADFSSRAVCGLRGGSFNGNTLYLASSSRYYNKPAGEDYDLGFRVASVPEPSSFAMLAVGAIGLMGWAWRRRK
ncbi:MAG: SUMF1/EgtB/PvdO family nonheme iron enzyme [Planctomycetota bacterium]